MAKPARRRVRYDLDSVTPLDVTNDLESLLSPTPSRRWNPSSIRSPLLEVEDRRNYHPLSDLAPVRSLRRWNVRVAAKPPKAKVTARPSLRRPLKFSFAAPEYVAVCIRRAQRKEVLHALKKTGKGSGRGRKTRNAFSNIRC